MIADYYGFSTALNQKFKSEFINSGYLSYGQKVKILEEALVSLDYGSSNIKKLLSPIKTLADLRNNVIHSIYGLNPERLDGEFPKMIIYANGRMLNKKDLLDIFSSFDKYHQESNEALNKITKILLKGGQEDE